MNYVSWAANSSKTGPAQKAKIMNQKIESQSTGSGFANPRRISCMMKSSASQKNFRPNMNAIRPGQWGQRRNSQFQEAHFQQYSNERQNEYNSFMMMHNQMPSHHFYSRPQFEAPLNANCYSQPYETFSQDYGNQNPHQFQGSQTGQKCMKPKSERNFNEQIEQVISKKFSEKFNSFTAKDIKIGEISDIRENEKLRENTIDQIKQGKNQLQLKNDHIKSVDAKIQLKFQEIYSKLQALAVLQEKSKELENARQQMLIQKIISNCKIKIQQTKGQRCENPRIRKVQNILETIDQNTNDDLILKIKVGR